MAPGKDLTAAELLGMLFNTNNMRNFCIVATVGDPQYDNEIVIEDDDDVQESQGDSDEIQQQVKDSDHDVRGDSPCDVEILKEGSTSASCSEIPPKFHRPRASLAKSQKITQVLSEDPEVAFSSPGVSHKRTRKGDGGLSRMQKLRKAAVADPANKMRQQYRPIINENKMKLLQFEIARYISLMNRETHTVEAQMLIPVVGGIPKHLCAKRMIMAESSFKLVEEYRNAISIDEYRVAPTVDVNGNPPIINYGVLNPVDTITSIWQSNVGVTAPGVSVTLVGVVDFPTAIKPGWAGLHLVYGGGRVTGSLPATLQVLILEKFTISSDVNWPQLLGSLIKLQIVILDDCSLADRLGVYLTTNPTLKAVGCLRGRKCWCYKTSIGRKWERTIEIVPENENNNEYYAMAAFKPKRAVFHTVCKIFYQDVAVLSRICETCLPPDVARAWSELLSMRKQLAAAVPIC
uniref:Genome assembly, chromosome: II n=1 Tax=Strongyloides venezuelensis TaxID=75913 RepID=A0A0K0F2A2_STRVS